MINSLKLRGWRVSFFYVITLIITLSQLTWNLSVHWLRCLCIETQLSTGDKGTEGGPNFVTKSNAPFLSNFKSISFNLDYFERNCIITAFKQII